MVVLDSDQTVWSATEQTVTYFYYLIKQAANVADIIYRTEDETR